MISAFFQISSALVIILAPGIENLLEIGLAVFFIGWGIMRLKG